MNSLGRTDASHNTFCTAFHIAYYEAIRLAQQLALKQVSLFIVSLRKRLLRDAHSHVGSQEGLATAKTETIRQQFARLEQPTNEERPPKDDEQSSDAVRPVSEYGFTHEEYSSCYSSQRTEICQRGRNEFAIRSTRAGILRRICSESRLDGVSQSGGTLHSN